MSSFSQRLKTKMQEFDLTQEGLAKKLGITRSAVAHYVQGTRHPPIKQVIKLATVFKTDPAWLQFGKAQESIKTQSNAKTKSTNRIPVLDWNEVSDFNFESYSSNNYLEFNYGEKKCYALLIKGDAMVCSTTQGQTLNPGSYVIIEPDREPVHGNFVVANTGNKKEPILRQYIEEGGDIYLKPLNPQYPLIRLERSTKVLGVIIANINFPF